MPDDSELVAERINRLRAKLLDLTTTNLATLPRTVAAAQKILALSAINFGLSDATSKRLDDRRIAATWQNLGERLNEIAAAMGRKVSDAAIDTVDFEGSGAYAQAPEAMMAKGAMRSAMAEPISIEEPSFEPGETTLHMRLVAKVRFK